MLVASSFVIAAAAAPVFGRLHLFLLDWSVRRFFSFVCHEIPERSFWIANEPAAICIRCFGIYSGAVFGALFRLRVGIARKFLLIAALLNAADVWAETWGVHGNVPALRFLLGLLLGISAGALACARINRNMQAVEFPSPVAETNSISGRQYVR